jgi:XTP/dITP diphosphohydrolase
MKEPPADWVLATHNPGKAGELRALFAELPIRLSAAADLDLPEPEETGTTFEANAELKAIAAASACGLPALADDSGVEVEALGGEPGIDTKLWAGPGADFAVARSRVSVELEKLGDQASRRARYICVLSVAWPDGSARSFRGETGGTLVWPIRGDLGHGSEPMFLPDGYAITYGEMTPEHRLRVNARASAFRKLARALFDSRGLRAGT